MNLEDAVVLITGGGSGIGRCLVDNFIKNNISIGVFEINKASISKLKRDYPNLRIWKCDVADDQSVQSAFQAIKNEKFEPNILINNAGFIYSEALINISSMKNRIHSRDSWEKVMSINLNSVFYMTSRFCNLLTLERKKGVVISISSVCAKGNRGQVAYSSAKAAVESFMATSAQELSPFGIRFMTIAPGFLNTESTYNNLNDETLQSIKKSIPLRSIGDPYFIYQTTKSIIECEYLTGSVINVDGGIRI